jgi:hypothetical protein
VKGVLLTNHVLSGALIGALARRPAPAFAVGVASHFALDAVPHWGDWGSIRRFLQVAVPDGLISLAAMGTLAALAPAERRPAVLAGMIGAALPDADKPAKLWFGRSPWPRPVDEFHQGIQREASGRAHIELLAASVFGVAALAALRRPAAFGQGRPAAFGQGRPVAFGQGRPAAFSQGRPARRASLR